MHTKNKIVQKFIAMLLVMAFFISTAAPTVASALEFDCYVAHMDATGGVLNTGNPYTPAESHSLQQIWLNISGSEWPALCLEFNTSCFHGDTYHYNDSHDGDHWDNLHPYYKRDIGLIMHYGYYNHTISRNDKAYFDATQLLVWEVSGYRWYNSGAPLRTFNYSAGTSSCATPLINYYTSPYRSDTVKAYNNIINSVKNHYVSGWYTSEANAKAHPVQLKYNSANGRFEATVSRVPSIWNDFGWTSKLEAKGIHVVNQGANSAGPGNNKYYLWTDHEITNPLPVSSIKQSTVNNDYNMVYVYSNSTRGTSGQSVARGANPDTLTAWLAVKTEPRLVKPAITIEKYAEDELIANLPNYASVQSGLYFALQEQVGSSWQNVAFTASGNTYTYNGKSSGDPYVLKLDDNGKFILSNLPYGNYRLYESYRGSPTGLKSAGLQNPPSSYVKEFTVSATSSATQQVINKKIISGSLEIDKQVILASSAPIPESAYTDLTFTIKDKSGYYLVLDVVDAAEGKYKYNGVTYTEAGATKIKLGTSTHKAVVTGMPIDTGYVVKELNSNSAYIAESDTVTVDITADTSSNAVFVNKEKIGAVKLVKSTTNKSNAVEGIHFIISGTTLTGREYTVDGYTDANGDLSIDNIPIGEYTVYEDGSTVPIGYITADEQGVTIEYGVTADMEFVNDTTKVQISKKAITGDDELAGAKLQVKDSSGKVVDEWTSGTEAHYIEAVLAAGETYTLHEEIAPDGYVVANDIEFTVSEDGSVDVVEMRDDTTKVQISKKAITGDEELAGAKLQVKDSSGKVVDEWTSGDEPHMIEGKLVAGQTYTLHEEIAPDGYVVANDIEFTVSSDGSIDVVEMKDDVTKVIVSKKTLTGDDELVGAHMKLLDSDGNVVDEWTSTSEPHDIYGKLVAGQTYTLHEEIAPDGYVVANDVEFTVSADGNIDVVEMKDDTTKVQISKKAITGDDELAGAKLQVKDSAGKVVDEWTSSDKPHMIEGKLTAGETYTLHEEYAPNGYVIANDIEFTVSEDGSVDVVEMRDDTTKVQISKQDITNGKELAGAKLQVKDSSGNVVDEWTSTDKPHMIEGKLVAGQTYTLHEEVAPDGYVVANDIEFTVSSDGKIDTVQMIDDIAKGTVSVQKTTEGMLNVEGIDLVLSGVSFLGLDVNITATTDENGIAVFEGVPIGTYTITEDKSTVPYGYLVADPIKGVEVVYAQQTDVEIFNAEMAGSIRIQKKTEGMINLKGIEFILSGVTDTGREIELKAKTDETGLAVFENVPIGTYTITENGETVPYGYITADPVEGVEVVYAQQTDVEIFNAEMTGSLRIHKKTAGMTHLGGIGFILSGVTNTGREIKLSVLTDETGLAVFKDIPVGTYTITEDGSTVPSGYFVAKPVTGVEVVYAEDTDITVVNESVPSSPKTGDTAPYAVVTVCTLIAAAALLLRKRTDNFVD